MQAVFPVWTLESNSSRPPVPLFPASVLSALFCFVFFVLFVFFNTDVFVTAILSRCRGKQTNNPKKKKEKRKGVALKTKPFPGSDIITVHKYKQRLFVCV